MQSYTLELCSFTASQALLDNPSISHRVYELIRLSEGLRNIFEGIDVDDSKKFWFILVWESYEHHKQLMDSAIYPEVRERLKACVGAADFKMRHVVIKDNPMNSLTAPVTELGALKVNDLSKKDEFIRLMHEMNEHDRRIARDTRELQYQPSLFGETLEEPGVFYFIAGWESVEDHVAVSQNPAGNKPFIEKAKPYITIQMAHAKVREYGLRRD